MDRRIAALVALLALLNACSTEPDGNSPSSTSAAEKPSAIENEAARSAFTAALPGKSNNQIFELIAPKVTQHLRAEQNFLEGVKATQGELIALAQSEAHVSEKLASEVVGALAGQDTSSRTRARKELEEAISNAISSLAKSENISEYAARQRLKPALKAAWPKLNYRFEPLNHLSPIELALPIPPADPKYEALLSLEQFWDDPRYIELSSLPAEKLPDGAIVPLLKLTGKSIPQAVLYDGCTRPREIIERYGARAHGAVVSYLSNPDSFGIKNLNVPPYSELMMFSKAPSELRKQIIKASLESGWNVVERYVPGDEEWADGLLDQFADSPYGVPERNPEGRVRKKENS